MCEILDNFDFDAADDTVLAGLVKSVTSFLKKAEGHYAKTVLDLSHNSEDTTPNEGSTIASKVEYRENFLEDVMLQNLKDELPALKYTPTGKKKPSVSLFGKERYVYSEATKDLLPQPIPSAVGEVLDCVNGKFGTHFNSVLVNKYANKNVALGWHQDNEDAIDQSAPLLTLSVGATRRFHVSDSPSGTQRTEMSTTELTDNSVYLMKSGLQSTHYHKVDYGRDNKTEERGIRYSLTFRRLTPRSEAPVAHAPTTSDAQPPQDDQHKNCYKCLVLGSSLTKGLKEDMLSRRGKRFAVYSNSGAHTTDIKQDLFAAGRDKDICRGCIEEVFFVCGGNDTENLRRSKVGPVGVVQSYETLLDYAHCIFPNAGLKVVSLLPRRLRYNDHFKNMIAINNKLSILCNNKENCKFIDIFSYFLKDKKAFYSNKVDSSSFALNNKLFVKDNLHLNWKGNSVLGKVIIGVTYNPRN